MSGVTAANLRQVGTQPDSKESFIAFDSTGNSVSSRPTCGIMVGKFRQIDWAGKYDCKNNNNC